MRRGDRWAIVLAVSVLLGAGLARASSARAGCSTAVEHPTREVAAAPGMTGAAGRGHELPSL
jgi:hypothetical protein